MYEYEYFEKIQSIINRLNDSKNFIFSVSHRIFVLDKDTPNWALITLSSPGYGEYINEYMLNIPVANFKILSSNTGYTDITLRPSDHVRLSPVTKRDYPLYMGNYNSMEFLEMLKES